MKSIFNAAPVFFLLLASLLSSCSEENLPAPNPEPPIEEPAKFVLEVEDNLQYPEYNRVMMITDTDGNRLEYMDIEQNNNYTFTLPEDIDVINVHVARFNEEYLTVESFIGFDSDTLTIHGRYQSNYTPEFTGKVHFDFDMDQSPWWLTAGTAHFTYFDVPQPWEEYRTTANFLDVFPMVYFIRDEIDEDVNDGYFFSENFDTEIDTFRITNDILSPLSELKKLDFTFPENFTGGMNMYGYYSPVDGQEQAQLQIVSQPGGGQYRWYDHDIYVPDFDIFEKFTTHVSDSKFNQGMYYLINQISSITSTDPVIPGFINADIDVLDYTPGEVKLEASGIYTMLNYSLRADNLYWDVDIYDESLDYSSYPDFPEEFYSRVGFGKLQDYKDKIDAGWGSLNFGIEIRNYQGSSFKQLSKFVDL